jgi:histidinol dehydrogenase
MQNIGAVQKIINDVKKNGDRTLFKYEKRFGGLPSSLRVSKAEIKRAYSQISSKDLTSINQVKRRLSNTEHQTRKLFRNIVIKSNDGIAISRRFTPLSSVGCYVPGGLARYPSSAVMSVVPAKIAGVKRIVVVSPTTKQGTLDPLTIVASDVCGATEIYKVGGAHAIAALAYGTKTISPVDKIVGPGGPYVTTAKYLASSTVSIDMLAGPTELCIICDDSANPEHVAPDIISQAEHSVDTLCYVITTSKKHAYTLQKTIHKHSHMNRDRVITINKSLNNNGFIAICKDKDAMIKLANALAPEHLQIMHRNPNKIAQRIHNAGLILLGPNTPSAASDYLLGSNHILPTNGFGKSRGSLSVLDFLKLGTSVTSNKSALYDVLKYMSPLTISERLSNHYTSVRSRTERAKKE